MGLGTVTGIDHPGFVVTDLQAAVSFMIDVLGCTDENRRGTLSAAPGVDLTRLFGVPQDAIAHFAFVRAGGDLIELMEWSAPGASTTSPSNCDAGGRHLALRTDDLDAAVRRVSAVPGVVVRDRSERGFHYVGTPFGLELQLY